VIAGVDIVAEQIVRFDVWPVVNHCLKHLDNSDVYLYYIRVTHH